MVSHRTCNPAPSHTTTANRSPSEFSAIKRKSLTRGRCGSIKSSSSRIGQAGNRQTTATTTCGNSPSLILADILRAVIRSLVYSTITSSCRVKLAGKSTLRPTDRGIRTHTSLCLVSATSRSGGQIPTDACASRNSHRAGKGRTCFCGVRGRHRIARHKRIKRCRGRGSCQGVDGVLADFVADLDNVCGDLDSDRG